MTTARLAKTRSEGHWALGEREPLNDTERMKHDDAPLNVRSRIENVYAKSGFDSIDKSGLRGRFRWMGLVNHRHEGERFATWATRADEEQLR
jgi:sulfite reductase (ferredoxin)